LGLVVMLTYHVQSPKTPLERATSTLECATPFQ
jgi:hypothetical protein